MYRYLLFSFIFFCSITTSDAQKLSVTIKYIINNPSDNSTIYYNANRKLAWNDFQGEPQDLGSVAAITSSGFSFNLGMHKSNELATMTIDVYCNFSKPNSWVKPDQKNAYILNHEQHHFDISYICTQHFIQQLKDADFTINNYQKVLKGIYSESIKEMNQLQNQYDQETEHSMIIDQQQEWDKRINSELKVL